MSLYHIITDLFNVPTTERHREEGRERARKEAWKEAWIEGWEIGWTKGWKEGIEEGRERANRAWRKWLTDREKAEAEGRPFDEPPPDRRKN